MSHQPVIDGNGMACGHHHNSSHSLSNLGQWVSCQLLGTVDDIPDKINVEQSHSVSQTPQTNGKVGGDTALADSALAAHDDQFMPNVGEPVLSFDSIVVRFIVMLVLA